MLLILVISKDYKALQLDISSTFIHTNIDSKVFIKLPLGYKDSILKDYYNNNKESLDTSYTNFINNYNKGLFKVKLKKVLYSLKQSPKL